MTLIAPIILLRVLGDVINRIITGILLWRRLIRQNRIPQEKLNGIIWANGVTKVKSNVLILISSFRRIKGASGPEESDAYETSAE